MSKELSRLAISKNKFERTASVIGASCQPDLRMSMMNTDYLDTYILYISDSVSARIHNK